MIFFKFSGIFSCNVISCLQEVGIKYTAKNIISNLNHNAELNKKRGSSIYRTKINFDTKGVASPGQ